MIWLRKLVDSFRPIWFCPCGLQEAEAALIGYCKRCKPTPRAAAGEGST